MNNPSNNTSFRDILRISTIFGLVILGFDFLELLIAPQTIVGYNSFWSNMKYLIWAVGVYYVLRWYHLRNYRQHFLKYFSFLLLVALFVSLYDVFFTLLYFNWINPQGKQVILDMLWANNPSLQNFGDSIKSQLYAGFSFYFSVSLILTYEILFSFYAVFYVIFLKLFIKPKNDF